MYLILFQVHTHNIHRNTHATQPYICCFHIYTPFWKHTRNSFVTEATHSRQNTVEESICKVETFINTKKKLKQMINKCLSLQLRFVFRSFILSTLEWFARKRRNAILFQQFIYPKKKCVQRCRKLWLRQIYSWVIAFTLTPVSIVCVYVNWHGVTSNDNYRNIWNAVVSTDWSGRRELCTMLPAHGLRCNRKSLCLMYWNCNRHPIHLHQFEGWTYVPVATPMRLMKYRKMPPKCTTISICHHTRPKIFLFIAKF